MNNAPVIDCGTFVLRPPRESDIADRLRTGRSAEYVRLNGGSTSYLQPHTEDSLRAWFNKITQSPCEWVVELDGRCVGIARLTVWASDRKARYAVGIFDETLYGKGLGTKITRAVLGYAFNTLCLHRVELVVLAYNTRAIRCYEKCGFVREGVERESALVDGVFYDDIPMSVLEHEFRALKID